MSDCATSVTIVGPPVVTQVRLRNKEQVRGYPLEPFPEGAWFTVDALASIFSISLNNMRVILSRNRHKLSTPTYRVKMRGTRATIFRIIPSSDYEYLRRLFPVFYGSLGEKRKRP